MAIAVVAVVVGGLKMVISTRGSDCGGPNGDGRYGPIVGSEVVTAVPIRSPKKGRGLASGEPKWVR